MKILLLSCSTGEGHNHCAKAVRNALEAMGHQTDFIDMLHLFGEPGPISIEALLNDISTKVPNLFGLMYKAGERVSELGVTSPVYLVNTTYGQRLSEFINDLDFVTAGDVYVSGDTLFLNDNTYVILNSGNWNGTIEWDSVLNHPTHLSQFINDLHFYVSGDTLFLNDSNYVILPQNEETQGLADVLNINNNAYGQIKNLSYPTDPLDAVNKAYVDSILAAEVAALNDRIDSITNMYEQIIDSVNNRIYMLEHPRVKGALPGIFSVSADKRINFSQGNLQYRPRIKTWRFAVNQYDIAGSDNNNVFMQAYCSSWVDLFGYGTSGWDGGAGRFMPYETTTNNTEYTEATDGNDLVASNCIARTS